MNWLRKTFLSKDFWLGKSGVYTNYTPDFSVTVIIPAWNEEEFIGQTIESVLNQSYKCKIVVVNDSSTDNTFEVASKYPVTVITTEKNQGSKSQALNYAREYVDTDLTICVDADTVLHKNAVYELIKAFCDKDVMVASGFVSSQSPNTIWSMGRYGEYSIGQPIYKSAQRNGHSVLVASGCFFGVRSHFFKEVGFKDRSMAEDMDLTWEAVENGYDVAFVENAICVVSDPDNFKTYYKQLERWYRGFFQCVKCRNFNLFKSVKLGVVAYFYMLINLIGMPLYIAAIISNPLVSVLSMCVIAYVFMFFGWYGAYKKGSSFTVVPWAVLSMMLLSPLNYAIYMKSAIEELILGRKLDVWVKGH